MMVIDLILCPSCHGRLGYQEDLDFTWRNCFACGRQFDEKPVDKNPPVYPYAPPDRPALRTPLKDRRPRKLKSKKK